MQQKCVFFAYSINNSSLSDYFVDLSNQFYESGYKVVVVSDKRGYQSQLNKSVIIENWPSKRPTKFRDLQFLLRLLSKHKPQLLISVFGSVNIFLLAGFFKGIRHRIVWIRTLSTQFFQKEYLVYRKSIIYKLSTHVVCNSEATKNDASKTYGIPVRKIKVLPNSVRDYSAKMNNGVKNYTTIVYAGRLHESKGIDTLIQAFCLIKKESINSKLYIIGQGSYEVFLKNLTVELDLQRDIVFLGHLSKPEVLNWFSLSGVVVVPSYSEAFGFTVIEAMSVKTCVIGANNTGIKEIIIHNETGLLFETGNVVELAINLKKVIINQELCDKLAAQGYQRFKNNYETRNAIIRDFEFLDKLLE